MNMSFEGLGQKHWKSDRVKDLERSERHGGRPGCVQVYTGDGKGKTTASLGLVLRAAGYGHRSMIVSFLKGDPNYGELRAIKEYLPMVEWHLAGRMGFVDPSAPAEEDVQVAQSGLEVAKQAMESGEFHVVVLDELNCAADMGLVDVSEVISIIKSRQPHVEVLITGRDAPSEFVEIADLVTEMRMVKHFYEAGIPARRGIEF